MSLEREEVGRSRELVGVEGGIEKVVDVNVITVHYIKI